MTTIILNKAKEMQLFGNYFGYARNGALDRALKGLQFTISFHALLLYYTDCSSIYWIKAFTTLMT